MKFQTLKIFVILIKYLYFLPHRIENLSLKIEYRLREAIDD